MFLKNAVFALLFLCAADRVLAGDIAGAGSSAAKPLYEKWAEVYTQRTNVKIAYAPVGSSKGLLQIRQRTVDFGASDVALTAADLKKDRLINFPSAISGVVPVVNLAGIKPGALLLTGEVLADIFARKVTRWNAPAIATLNPGLLLPDAAIVVVVRQDGSGTTYNFSDYLSKMQAGWRKNFGRGFTIAWPAGVVPVKGSSAVAAGVKQIDNAIGYVDYNYVVQEKLTYVRLKNRQGNFVAPNAQSFASALKNSTWLRWAAFEEMLTDKSGAESWPITMGTFIIIAQVAQKPENAIATLKFFNWAFMHGDHLATGLDFVRLPDTMQARVYAEMLKVTDQNGKPLHWSEL
ncbi:MAG: phosphate ABC transporter substrate-binding protein PstS [Glaciimonas sp.]|nr:phosphate ABC transporter substrate-binding protein PstS [Glaciimonas sp.]